MKNKFWLILFCLFFFISPVKVLADDNFDISYQFSYQFLDSGRAKIEQITTLVNKKTNLYATEYEMLIVGEIVGEVSGFDEAGPLTLTTVKESANKTRVKVIFNQKAVGIGNKLTFSLYYELTGLVNKIGQVKEISLPKPSADQELTSYQVKVLIPQKFGPVAFVKPLKNFTSEGDFYVFSFDYNDITKGVLIGLGEYNNFEFQITYHLKNPSLITKKTEVAFLPDTLYQQVIYSSIDPPPAEFNFDADGNLLATYPLKPQEKKEVIIKGNVLVYSRARQDFLKEKPIEAHLRSIKYWEKDSEIEKIAQGLTTPLAIYDYVVSSLRYNYARVNSQNERLGAKSALVNQTNATCMEFTDLFIALARAKGIPAREVNGYAYTSDEFFKPLSLVFDVLHAWPEYWDEENQKWVAVDPTWANTTGGLDYFHSLDLNRVVFVRRGVSSFYPLAAGSYRLASNQNKDVEIKPQEDWPKLVSSPWTIEIDLPQKQLLGVAYHFVIKIKNNDGWAKYNVPLTFEAKGVTIKLKENTINLPPYGEKIIQAEMVTNQRFWGTLPIKFLIGNEVKNLQVEFQPKEFLYLPVYVAVFLVSLIIFLYWLRQNVFAKKT